MSEAAPSGDNPEQLIIEGRKLLRAGKVPLAAAYLERAVKLNSTSVEGHELLAKCAFLSKDHAKAEEHFRQAAKCDSRRIEPLVNLGAVQNIRKDYAAAIKTLQKVVTKRAGRSSAQAYYNLGIAYRGGGQSSMAVQAYREAIRLDSDFAEAHQNLGNAYLDQNNARQARSCFERALELKPTLKGAQRGLERTNSSATKRDPFGGLKADGRSVGPAVALSETARINDRAVLRDLMERVERSVKAMSAELRNDMEPGIKAMVKGISGAPDPLALTRTARNLESSAEDVRTILDVLKDVTREIREHENQIAAG